MKQSGLWDGYDIDPKPVVPKQESIPSVMEDQDDILRAIIQLHLPEGSTTFDCDCTYGNGVFYRSIEEPEFRYDIDPQVEGVEVGDWKDLPHEDGSLSSVIADPPFLVYVKKEREHNCAMAKRFGGYWGYEDLLDDYNQAIKEASRVLRKKGILVFKLQNMVVNHKYRATDCRVINMAEHMGFRIKDHFLLYARNRMPGPQKGQQRHARVHHSSFLVFEKTR